MYSICKLLLLLYIFPDAILTLGSIKSENKIINIHQIEVFGRIWAGKEKDQVIILG